ncbi:MAG: DUF423 domain-containing protein [Cyclobacteriaceae bacterium]|nr:DUF423 domain-containing protein [Cyclobacteriaceae bacterium]
MKNIKIILLTAAISGALVVGLGAVGSHVLGDLLISNERTDTYLTAIRYHSFHTIALLCFGILSRLIHSEFITRGIYLMIAGMVLFSGSLYLLSLYDKIWFAYITPVGGILLILSWMTLFYGIYQGKWTVNNRE